MAFNYMENISYNNNRPNFERDSVKTIAQLLAVNPAEKGYDYGHIVFCEEDGKHYKFNYDYENPPKESEKDSITGWFVPSDGTRKALKNSDGNVLSKGYIILNSKRDFVSQLNYDDIIYEIRDYFDLNGETITLPKNCVLKFEGGMLANGTINGNGVAIEAPLVKIFNDDITLKGDFNCDFYPEWFGAVTYSEETAVDNTAVFNNAVDQIYNMNGAHDLILTGAYLIRDTIFLKPKVSLIGRYGRTRYDINVGDKEIGSGFLVDFEDNNRYAIDSCLTQIDENGAYTGKKQAIINYNHLWFDAEAAAEDSYTLSDKIVGTSGHSSINAAVDNIITKRLWAHGWRKSTNIKNITLQPLNKPTTSGEIPFGGIRLIGWYSGTIDSVTIQGFAVCLNVAESWACCINRLNITTYYIGVYLGKFCTQYDIRNSDIERVGNNVVFNHKDAALVYRSKSNLLLPYDEEGRVEGDEGFTHSITKYIAEPETVADDFITNHKSTQLLTVAIMTESYDYDQTKLLLDNIIFQFIDGIFINTNSCNVSFNFCYIEGVSKLGLYSHSGTIKWLNSSYKGGLINPYGAVTFKGRITIDGMNDPRCYPSYTMEDIKSGHTDPLYYITPQGLYYDKFSVTPGSDAVINQGVPTKGTVNAGSIAAAKQLIPINNIYYIGKSNWVDKHNWHSYTSLASGLERDAWIPFNKVLELYDPKVATFYLAFSGDDYSGGDVVLKGKDFTFIRYNDTDDAAFFPSTPMRLEDSKIKIIKLKISTNKGEIDHVFEVAGKCSIWADFSDALPTPPTKIVKLVSDDNRPVELDFFFNRTEPPSGNWGYNIYKYYFSHLDEYGIKYTLRLSTQNGSHTYTNQTPPTIGVEKGETFIYNGNTLVWNGSSWDTQLIPNYDLYVTLGAEYNNTGTDIIKTAPWGEVTHKAGYWYYNGIGDLSTNDMSQIYSHKDILTTGAGIRYGTARLNELRTIVPMEFAQSVSQISIDSVRLFFRCEKLQVLRWAWKGLTYNDKTEVTFDTTNTDVMPKMGANMENAFGECLKLQYIYPINVSDTTSLAYAFRMWTNCELRDVRLYGLKASVNFIDCPYLTKECLMYIISNANPTTAITITLHATAHANLAEDAEIVTKLEEKNAALSANGGSISLKSA